jgi:hypothetical protein
MASVHIHQPKMHLHTLQIPQFKNGSSQSCSQCFRYGNKCLTGRFFGG